MYAIRYWFCEFLCLVNIIIQLILMDRFFDGEFFGYGLRYETETFLRLHLISIIVIIFCSFIACLSTATYRRTIVSIRWFTSFPEWQSVSFTSMVHLERFRSTTVSGKWHSLDGYELQWHCRSYKIWLYEKEREKSLLNFILLFSSSSTQHSATEHCKRKDLHLHLVLVSHPCGYALRTPHLSSAHHLCAIGALESAQRPKSYGAARNCRVGDEKGRHWWLVDYLHARP